MFNYILQKFEKRKKKCLTKRVNGCVSRGTDKSKFKVIAK
jgi:hypothetical protein